MAGKREKNRVRSRIDELPEDQRALLDRRLADIGYTYRDIADELKGNGYEISRSAIGRYALRHNSAARRLREAREQTEALLQFVRDDQNIDASELASAILMDGLTRRIATADEDMDAMPVEKAGRLLVQLQRSTVYRERFRKDRRAAIESVERTILSRVRSVLKDTPALLAEIEKLVREAAQEEAQREDV